MRSISISDLLSNPVHLFNTTTVAWSASKDIWNRWYKPFCEFDPGTALQEDKGLKLFDNFITPKKGVFNHRKLSFSSLPTV